MMKCIFCLHDRLRPSKIRLYERPLLALRLRLYRCGSCGRRSIHFAWSDSFVARQGPIWFERKPNDQTSAATEGTTIEKPSGLAGLVARPEASVASSADHETDDIY